ncbi:aminotransferase class V-fold PLP-dependent enzyme [Exiguobacterium sp. SH5S4]|nr:aminotransferase class V-fold PLP-dependent enzyme [Exiguobacterium sp. SH5S4]
MRKGDTSMNGYFDYAATHPMTQAALDHYVAMAKGVPGNPSSLHTHGFIAEDYLTEARRLVKQALGLDMLRGKLLFTGSGSESNYIALTSLRKRMKGSEVITSWQEHDSVSLLLDEWEAEGVIVHRLKLKDGQFDHDKFLHLLDRDIGLVTFQHVNSDTGWVLPLHNILCKLKYKKVLLHIDGVQALGKIPVSVDGIDAYSFSAHKVGGPKGVGGLYMERLLPPPYYPGHHQYGIRPGTIDVPGISAFVKAFTNRHENRTRHERNFLAFRAILKEKTSSHVDWLEFDDQSPAILSFVSDKRDGQWWMTELDALGFQVSAGSACRAGQNGPNRMLESLGYETSACHGLVRISFGEQTTAEATAALADAIATLARRVEHHEQTFSR